MSTAEVPAVPEPAGDQPTVSETTNASGESEVSRRTSSAVEHFAENYVPESMKETLIKAAPAVGAFVEFLATTVVPFFIFIYSKFAALYRMLQPYHIDDLVPSIMGLVICFFGGSYLTLIAAAEAYRIVGWHPTMEAIKKLHKNAQIALDASKKDDNVDADGNGLKDVQEMLDRGEVDAVLKRKVGVVLKSVDPDEVSDAFNAINSGLMAVLATLKLQFARAITLGIAIGDIITKPALRFLEPPLAYLMAKEYKKWAGPVIKWICKSIAISIAWYIQRIISAFHSSIRGGLMFSRGILSFLEKIDVLHWKHEDTLIDELVGFGVAFLGFYTQFTFGFSLPFPLNVIFLPFTIAEYWLMWLINWD